MRRASSGLFDVTLRDGTVFSTHGPDFLAPGSSTETSPDAPERAPVCAPAGTFRQRVLHGYIGSDSTVLARPAIQAVIRRNNYALDQEAMALANRHADYRVACDLAGAILVDSFAAPPSGASFSAIIEAARSAGFTSAFESYTIFYDGSAGHPSIAGQATFDLDDRANNNLNNLGPAYAVIYGPVNWPGIVAMHENGHNQGAVQFSAPHSTGASHCTDEQDVMCSADGGPKGKASDMEVRCTDWLHFDCGGDDYFHPAPARGSYLATHWNLGSTRNNWLTFSAP